MSQSSGATMAVSLKGKRCNANAAHLALYPYRTSSSALCFDGDPAAVTIPWPPTDPHESVALKGAIPTDGFQQLSPWSPLCRKPAPCCVPVAAILQGLVQCDRLQPRRQQCCWLDTAMGQLTTLSLALACRCPTGCPGPAHHPAPHDHPVRLAPIRSS